ncbi:MAG TPA: hypothetical protein ENN07_00775 [candidate division Zixibacteria bacterium]|nr:hypothetical protein [candidate division Zixibacteria bacterium]
MPRRAILTVAIFAIAISSFAQHPSFDPRYHTVSQVIEAITALADTYSTYCVIESLGYSGVDSITIWGVKITENPHLEQNKTVVEIHGGMHGDEPAGVEVCMWMIRDLLHRLHSGDSIARTWWEELEIWIIPQMNPDGRVMCLDSGYIDWRKTKRDLNFNGIYELHIDGVDPNRNWDYMWDEYVAPTLEFEKGPYPFSEQCVITMRDFYIRKRPVFAVDFHSPCSTGGNKMWFSWFFNEGEHYGHGPDAINNWLEIRTEYANATLDEEGNTYARGMSYHTTPKLQTWTYFHLGICSIVLEITNQRFWEGEIIDTISARVGRGTYTLLDRALRQMLITHVVDTSSGEPITDAIVNIAELQHPYFPPRTVDPVHGTNRRLLREGYYTVDVSATGYHPKTLDSVYVSSGPPTELTVALRRDLSIAETDLPHEFAIRAYPNPFNSALTISIEGVGAGLAPASIEIYDVSGRRVACLGSARQPDGTVGARHASPATGRIHASPTTYEFTWQPSPSLPSGVYLVRARFDSAQRPGGGRAAAKRVVYLK